MSNAGNFIDRSPFIIPAGFEKYRKHESVKNCLVEWPVADVEVPPKIKPKYPLPPLVGGQYDGVYTKMRAVLQPSQKSTFLNLLSELKETRYESYWNNALGRSRDFTPGLPAHIHPEKTRFGIKTHSSITARDIVNPKKDPADIIADSEVGHRLYIKTHRDYYPGEQIDRQYDHPVINKDLIWGKLVPHNKAGKMVKCALTHEDQEPKYNHIEKCFREWSSSKLGKTHQPNKNIEKLPEGFRFGRVYPEEKFGVEQSLRSTLLSSDKQNLKEELKNINHLRLALSKRSPPFPNRDFLSTCQYRDKQNTGFLSLKEIYEVSSLFSIDTNKPKLEALLRRMGIMLEDNNVHYGRFTTIICGKYAFPDVEKIQDLNEEQLSYYKSEYQRHYKKLNKTWQELKKDGIPATKMNNYSLGNECNVYELITPSIYTQYGVGYDEFTKARTKEQIKTFFKNIKIELPGEIFETVWNVASKKNEHGFVCIESFKNELRHQCPDIKLYF